MQFSRPITVLALAAALLAACGAPSAATAPPSPAGTAPARASGASAAASATTTSALEVVWTTDGGEQKFSFARRLAVDSEGSLYVLDNANDRVQVFDANGQFVTMWGSRGAADGQFIVSCQTRDCPPACAPPTQCHALPGAIAVDAERQVYVADYTGRVQKFDRTGTLLAKWGSKGTGEGQLDAPIGMAVDAQGNVIVGDEYQVTIFGPDGAVVTTWGSQVSREGQFDGAGAIALDAQGNVYVADDGNHRVQKFDPTGRFLLMFGSEGAADGQFLGFAGLAVDRHGTIWVLDNPLPRLQQFNSTGQFVRSYGSYGSGDGEFTYPDGLTMDSDGNVYVADLPVGPIADNSRVQKLRLR